MKKYIITFMLLLLFMGTYDLLSAQPRQGKGGRGGKPPQGMRPGDQQHGNRQGIHQREAMKDLKRLEQLRMLKLLDLLDLDETTESKIIPHIRRHHKQMFQLMRKHQGKIDQLANGLRKQNLSDQEIIDRIIKIDELEQQRNTKIKEFHLKAQKLLTPEQLGKLYVFQARFGGEVLEKMGHFRKAQRDFHEHNSGN